MTSSRVDTALPAQTARRAYWKTRPSIFFIVAAIFFIKFSAYAWFVTPLWEIPDESGHYSYVEDLSHGHYPVLGEARMTDEVSRSWLGPKAKPGVNWIAQHPPLFYALSAPIVHLANAAGMEFEQRVRSARTVSSLFGALTLLGLGLFIRNATGRPLLGLAGAIFIGATPMFVQLSSGVTHDTLVACTSVWAAYWCQRWLKSGSLRHALICGAFIALCTITKVTGIAVAVPLFAAMSYRLLHPSQGTSLKHRIFQVSALWLVMFLPMCLWMARNFLQFQQLMPDASIFVTPRPVEIGYLQFVKKHPIWQNVLLNFIALVGWTGQSHGKVNFVQATGLTAQYFSGSMIFCCMAVALHSIREFAGKYALHAALLCALLLSAYLSATLITHTLATLVCVGILAIVCWTIISNLSGAIRNEENAWLMLTASACILFFSLLYYNKIWQNHLTYGVVKALHGRYFYTVLPFFCLIMLKPLSEIPLSRAALYAATIAMLVSDAFFLRHVFPLYGQI